MNKRFSSSDFIERVLEEELSMESFSARMSALTVYQQMQVLLRLLTLRRMEEKERREEMKKAVPATSVTRPASLATGSSPADGECYDETLCDPDDGDVLSDNMLRVLDIIGGEADAISRQ